MGTRTATTAGDSSSFLSTAAREGVEVEGAMGAAAGAGGGGGGAAAESVSSAFQSKSWGGAS